MSNFVEHAKKEPDPENNKHNQICVFCGKNIPNYRLICDDCKKLMSDQIDLRSKEIK